MVEVLVSMLFFLPVFLMVPVIGKYLDVKQKTIEASRYAAWERSVWADPGHNWGKDTTTNSKSDDIIATEVDRRFFGHLSQMISHQSALPHKDGVVDNPMWNTTNTKIEMFEKKQNGSTKPVESYLPILKGVKTGSKKLRAFTEIKEQKTPATPLVVGQVADMMKLGAEDYVIATVSTPIKNHSISKDDKLVISAKSALLTNTWSAPDEAKFEDRVDSFYYHETANGIVKTGIAIASVGLIALGLYHDGFSFSVEPAVDSTVLPDHLKRKEAAPDEDENTAVNGSIDDNDYDLGAANNAVNEVSNISLPDGFSDEKPALPSADDIDIDSTVNSAKAEGDTANTNLQNAEGNLTDEQAAEVNTAMDTQKTENENTLTAEELDDYKEDNPDAYEGTEVAEDVID